MFADVAVNNKMDLLFMTVYLICVGECNCCILYIYGRPKKLGFKSFKRYFFVFRDTTLSLHRSYEERDGTALLKYNLKGWLL